MRFYKNDLADVYKKQRNIALLAFLLEAPNLIVTISIALSASTIICWADCSVSLSNTLHALIVLLIAEKMRKETGDRYNYGMDRLEVFISFICDISVFFGMCAILGTSIYGFFVPQLPASSLWIYLILKVSNSFWDLYFYISERKLLKKHESKMGETEAGTHFKNLMVDMVIGGIACICYIFRTKLWVAYLSPATTSILMIYFMIETIKHIKGSINELSDVSLPIKAQDEIFDIVLEHSKEVKKIEAVNCHLLNHKTYVDLCVIFKDDSTFKNQMGFLNSVKDEVEKIMPNSVVRLVSQIEETK